MLAGVLSTLVRVVRFAPFAPACLALVSGCAAYHMREVRPAMPIQAANDGATVLFVRPHAYPAGVMYTVLDTQIGAGGREVRFLGESAPSSHFAVVVPAGEHVFLSAGNGHADAVKAKVEAGRIYFVEVDSGVFHGMHLLALGPSREKWKEVHGWLDETTQLVPDRLAGQADLMHRSEMIDDAISDALGRLKDYDAGELAERTLTPEDGVR